MSRRRIPKSAQREDVQLRAPFTMILAGPSRCGKTTFVHKLLKNKQFVVRKPPQKVIYFFNQWQPALVQMRRENLVHTFISRLPTLQDVRSLLTPSDNGLIVIDDFMKDANSDLGYIFTALSHHHNVSVIFLSQNLFSQHGPFRDMSLSATYIVCFKNPRDASQIWHFARQFRPDRPARVVEGFRAATIHPYSYVVFDFHPETPDFLRMRSRIIPGDGPMIVIPP